MLGRTHWNRRAIGSRLAAWAVCGCLILTASAEEGAKPQLLPVPAPQADGAILLAYKFQPGQFLHYEVSNRVQYVTQQGDNRFNAIQQNETAKHFRVVSVDEQGIAILEPVVDRAKMSAQFHDQPPVNFDSQTDGKVPEQFKAVKETIGRPLARFHFEPNGKLVKVVPTANDVPKTTQAAEKTDPSVNFLVVMPSLPISIGHTWKEKYETLIDVGKNGLKQPVPLQRQYELTGVADGLATIKFRTIVLAPVNDPEVLRQLVQQTPAGTIEFDIDRGLIRLQTSIINENVVNAFGPQTKLEVAGKSTEKLVKPAGGIQQAGLSNSEETTTRVTPAGK